MKKKSVLLTGFVITLAFFVIPGFMFAYGNWATGFTSPQAGDTIENRKDFIVSMEIDNFDKVTGHYWAVIASVTGHSGTWDRVLRLYQKIKVNNAKYEEKAVSEMKKLISNWELDLIWPKFYIPHSPYEGNIYDGGQNPLKGLEPQPMILLIIKVDDTMQKYIRKWFQNGEAGKGYPGIKAAKFSKKMILTRCEIFFP